MPCAAVRELQTLVRLAQQPPGFHMPPSKHFNGLSPLNGLSGF